MRDKVALGNWLTNTGNGIQLERRAVQNDEALPRLPFLGVLLPLLEDLGALANSHLLDVAEVHIAFDLSLSGGRQMPLQLARFARNVKRSLLGLAFRVELCKDGTAFKTTNDLFHLLGISGVHGALRNAEGLHVSNDIVSAAIAHPYQQKNANRIRSRLQTCQHEDAAQFTHHWWRQP